MAASGCPRPPATSGGRRTFPKATATITWNGDTPASATWCLATSRRATRRRSATKAAASAKQALRCTSISPKRSRGWASTPSGALRQPVRHVQADHRRESVQRADAHLPRHPLHDGRALGGLQPDEHASRACTSSAKRTSPTTARIGSAPARSCRGWRTATSSSRTRLATISRRRHCPRSRRNTTASRRPPRRRRSGSRGSCRSRGSGPSVDFHRAMEHVLWDDVDVADRRGPA